MEKDHHCIIYLLFSKASKSMVNNTLTRFCVCSFKMMQEARNFVPKMRHCDSFLSESTVCSFEMAIVHFWVNLKE